MDKPDRLFSRDQCLCHFFRESSCVIRIFLEIYNKEEKTKFNSVIPNANGLSILVRCSCDIVIRGHSNNT